MSTCSGWLAFDRQELLQLVQAIDAWSLCNKDYLPQEERTMQKFRRRLVKGYENRIVGYRVVDVRFPQNRISDLYAAAYSAVESLKLQKNCSEFPMEVAFWSNQEANMRELLEYTKRLKTLYEKV